MGLFSKRTEISDTAKELEEYRKKRERDGAYNIDVDKFYGGNPKNRTATNDEVISSTQNNNPSKMSYYQQGNNQQQVHTSYYQQGDNQQQVHTSYYQQGNNQQQVHTSYYQQGDNQQQVHTSYYQQGNSPQQAGSPYYKHGNNQQQKKSQNMGTFIAIWILASFVGMFIAFQIAPAVGIIIFGLFFTVIGIFACFFSGPKRQYIALVFVLVGVIIIAVSLMVLLNVKFVLNALMQAVPYLFLSVFFFIGLGLILVPYINKRRKIKRCTDKSIARVIDLKRRRGSKGGSLYCPVYEYLYNGEMMRTNYSVYRNYAVPKLGEEFEILINPQDPTDTYIYSGDQMVGNIILGIIFIFIPVFMAVMIITSGI